MRRKDKPVTGEIYHIFNKSISDFKIFNGENDFLRIKNILRYYQIPGVPFSFCHFMQMEDVKENGFIKHFTSISDKKEKLVQIIAYCIMPTHLHLILKQLKDDGISIFIGNVLNSYTRYFNIKHERKGPLWEGKFKNILVERDEQLLHLTRYVHLNPVTAYLVDRPEDWPHSSYLEYLSKVDDVGKICSYGDILDIDTVLYKQFVEDNISYQRELAKIKDYIFTE